jgi:hypothetical protein
MGKVLGIEYHTLATHITKKVGYKKQMAQTDPKVWLMKKSLGTIFNSPRLAKGRTPDII